MAGTHHHTTEIKNCAKAGTAVEVIAFCNQKGEEGWELISAQPDTIGARGLVGTNAQESRYRLLFKRARA